MKNRIGNIVPALIIAYGSVRNGVIDAMLNGVSFYAKLQNEFSDITNSDLLEFSKFVRAWMEEPRYRPEGNSRFCYLKCDDWFIYAKDKEGNVYSLVTECWGAWNDLHEGADQEEGAVEKYMLPIAFKKWDSMDWRKCPDIEAEARNGLEII